MLQGRAPFCRALLRERDRPALQQNHSERGGFQARRYNVHRGHRENLQVLEKAPQPRLHVPGRHGKQHRRRFPSDTPLVRRLGRRRGQQPHNIHEGIRGGAKMLHRAHENRAEREKGRPDSSHREQSRRDGNRVARLVHPDT